MEDWLVAHYGVLKDFSAPGISFLGLVATVVVAVIGFSTLGRWRREQLEGRRIRKRRHDGFNLSLFKRA